MADLELVADSGVFALTGGVSATDDVTHFAATVVRNPTPSYARYHGCIPVPAC